MNIDVQRAGLQQLSARQQLAVRRDYPKLIPALAAMGLELWDCGAVAYHCTLLWHALDWQQRPAQPAGLLDLLSLGQIAQLCHRYGQLESGQLEWGSCEDKGEKEG